MCRLRNLVSGSLLVASLFALSGNVYALNVGDKAPNIFGRTLDKKIFRLSTLKGPTVVNFFWVECKPCIKEMPEMAHLEQDHPGVNVVAVHVPEGGEELDVIKQFVTTLEAHPSTIVASSLAVKKAYGFKALPHTVIVNEGKVDTIVVGYTKQGFARLSARVNEFSPKKEKKKVKTATPKPKTAEPKQPAPNATSVQDQPIDEPQGDAFSPETNTASQAPDDPATEDAASEDPTPENSAPSETAAPPEDTQSVENSADAEVTQTVSP